MRDVDAMAQMARTRMRAKVPSWAWLWKADFGEHHALMLRMHLDHVDHLAGI